MKDKEPVFEKEADLCKEFLSWVPKDWTAYPETGDFDILLVRNEDGFQIGIEAKLKLNAKVILQAAERPESYYATAAGPDCRAVLVPYSVSMELAGVCRLLGITVIKMRHPASQRYFGMNHFHPELPDLKRSWSGDEWQEFAPHKRLEVPDWVPDVSAGVSSPLRLTFWKVGAIKLAILLERRGCLLRKDFKKLNISMTRWTQSGWLKQNGEGGWIRGEYFPDFKAQHPTNYLQIEADYEKWKDVVA